MARSGPEGDDRAYLLVTPHLAKTEAYRTSVAESAYPLLEAFCVDLARFVPGSSLNFNGLPMVRVEEDEALESNPWVIPPAREKISKALEKEGISFSFGKDTFVRNNLLKYPISEGFKGSNPLDVSLSAESPDDLAFFHRGLLMISEPLGYIPQMPSLASDVQQLLETIDPLTNYRYANFRALKAVVDGVFSTYVAAVSLSQRPIIGKEDLSTRDRLLLTLRSNATTDFTRGSRLTTLARLASVGIIPDNQLVAQGDDLVIYPDEEAFLDIANRFLSEKTPPPRVCPFVPPLGEKHAQGAIERQYQGQLPVDVVAMIHSNKRISGIKTTAQGLADYLERVI
jgi:hypothetical protein